MLIVIPCRGGSKRIPGKALKELAGKPLLVWAIDRAKATGFPWIVATEDEQIAVCARGHGAAVWMRDPATATDDAPDYSWARELPERYPTHDLFAILRITSPFLSAVRRLKWMTLSLESDGPDCSSVRCVTSVSQHPAKMWRFGPGGWGEPAMQGAISNGTPWHSSPTQLLPPVYVQTAGLEVTRRDTLRYSLAGGRVGLHIVEGAEALDINTPEDWARAEEIAKTWTAR